MAKQWWEDYAEAPAQSAEDNWWESSPLADAEAVPPAPTKGRTALQVGSDAAYSVLGGINSLAKIPAMAIDKVVTGDAYGPGVQALNDFGEAIDLQKTDYIRGKESASGQRVTAAGQQVQDYVGDNMAGKAARMAAEFGVSAYESVKDPELLVNSVANQLPMLGVMGGFGRVASGAAGKVAQAVPAVASTKIGSAAVKGAATGGAVTAGAVMQGTDIGTGTYERIMALPDADWAANPEYVALAERIGADAAKQQMASDGAANAAYEAGAASIATSMLPGGTALEKALVGKKTIPTLKSVGGAVVGEARQEGLEEGFGQFSANRAVAGVNPSQDLTEGVGGAVGQGAVLGGLLGGGATAYSGGRDLLAEKFRDRITPPPPVTQPAQPGTPGQGAGGSQPMQAAPTEPTAAEKALRTPVALTSLDRVNEIDQNAGELQARLAELNDPASGYGPMFDQERLELTAKTEALTAEKQALTKDWPVALDGKPASFTTEAGARVEAKYALMDAADLVTSHDEALRQNPAYPQELQPRARDRAASEMQVSGIVQKLDPARLGLSADAANGAPIVGADGLVESGNARTIALKRVYQANGQKAADYKQFLRDNADQFGLTPEAIDGMAKPVLVRVRTTPVNRAEFARQANASTVAMMSPSETAKADASRIESMEDLTPDESGDFSNAASQPFVRRFMARLPQTEQAGMVDATGNLSTAGYARVRNAVLAKAYGDSPVLARMTESMDDNLRNVSRAFLLAAPKVASMRAAVKDGTRFDADITPDLMAAAEELSKIKSDGGSVQDALAQIDMMGEQRTPEARQLLQFMSDNMRRPRRMADFISAYMDALDAAGDPNQGSLLGDVQAPAKQDLLKAAERTTQDATQDTQRGNPGENARPGAQAGGQPQNAPGSESRAQGDGAAGRDTRLGGEQNSEQVVSETKQPQATVEKGPVATKEVVPSEPESASPLVAGDAVSWQLSNGKTVNGVVVRAPDRQGGTTVRATGAQTGAGVKAGSVFSVPKAKLVAAPKTVDVAAETATPIKEDKAEPIKAEHTTADKASRQYHLVAVNEKTGAKTSLTRYPMSHAQAVTNMGKFDSKPGRRIELEEADKPVDELADETMLSRGASSPDQTDTAAFKSWFGDSKVVDTDGQPLVVYHGTSANEQGDAFTSFDTYASNYGLMGMGGYFTADPAVASSYTTKGRGSSPSVYPVFLSIKKPLDMDAMADAAAWTGQFDDIEAFHDGGTTNESWYRAAEDMLTDQEIPKYEGAEIMQDGLRAMGFDGITHVGGGRVKADGIRHRVFIAFDPEQIKSATGNNGNFDGTNPDIRLSRKEQAPDAIKNLVTLHNLSAENLLHAADMGGIPVPSIGITKVDSAFGGFGEITLIAPKSMIDPASGVPVFDRDAYTSRYPTMNFKKVKANKADAFYERMNAARRLFDFDDGFVSQIWDAIKNSSVQNPDKVWRVFQQYDAPRLLFAKEVLGKEVKIPMREVSVDYPWVADKQFAKTLAALRVALMDYPSQEVQASPEAKELSDAARAAIERFADRNGREPDPELRKDLIQALAVSWGDRGEWATDPEAVMGWKALDRIFSSAKNVGKTEVDKIKLSKQLDKLVPIGSQAYADWAMGMIKPLFDAPTITLRGKEVEPTLDNVVDAMTAGGIAGAEETMVSGPGKVAALLGKRFKSLAQIQAARDQVVPEATEKAGKEVTDKVLQSYRDRALSFYTETDWRGQIDTWGAMDASMEALAVAGKAGTSDAAIRSALSRKGFKAVDQTTVDLARQAIDAIRNSATNYFEAKPQRAVKLSEFRGAVVPKGTGQEVLDVLAANGVEVLSYNKKDPLAKNKAVEKLARKMDKADGDVLFSRAAGDTSQRGMDLKALKSLAYRIRANMPNMPDVHVYASPDDLPERAKGLRDYIELQGAMQDVEGAMHKGELYLFASGLADALRAEHVLAEHEAAHVGLRAVLGGSLNTTMLMIYNNNTYIRQLATELQKHGKLSNAAATEEAIVDIPSARLVKLQGWRKLVVAARNWLESHGYEAMAKKISNWLDGTLTDQQRADLFVADLVRGAREYIAGKREGRTVTTGTMLASTLAEDIARQEKWLMAEAKARGYKDIDQLAEQNYPLFEKLAELWRKKNPAENGVLLSRAPAGSTGANVVASPPPAKGLVRYYHGGNPEAVTGPLWFTTDLRDANGWAARAKGMQVWFVDVPENDPVRGGDPQFGVLPPARIDLPASYANRRQVFVPTAAERADKIIQTAAGTAKTSTGPFQEKSEVQHSRAGLVTEPDPIAPRDKSPLQKAKSKALGLTSPDALGKLVYDYQDKYIDLKRIRDHIKAIGGTITDLNDAYLAEELYHKRLAKKTEDFLELEVKPLLADLRSRGVGAEEFEQFLHARHAPEANKAMAARNPTQAEIDAGKASAQSVIRALQDQLAGAVARGAATTAIQKSLELARQEGAKWIDAQAFKGTEEERLSLSGMTDAQAASIMASLTPAKLKDMQALAARVDAINAKTMDALADYGLMDQESLGEWRKAYQFYIPLHRDEAHPDSASHPVGQGFSVKGDAAKRRTGSNAKVTNILGHIAMQREAALTRGEKNAVTKKLFVMAAQNPDPDLWTVGVVPTVTQIDKKTGFAHTYPDPNYKNHPNVVLTRIGGKDAAIVFNPRNEQGVRLAGALKNMDVGDLGVVLSQAAKITRWFAAVNTQYNPVFGLVNFARDIQAAMLNLSTTPLAGQQAKVAKAVPAALRAVYRVERGKAPSSPEGAKWAALWEDLQQAGGTTGYRDMYPDANERMLALVKELQKLDRGQVRQAASAVVEWLSDYNDAIENGVRLSAYAAALEHGMSRDRAASLAKNLTVNFNRKGAKGREISALYAFFNAAIQGNARMFETLRGPIGKKIMFGGVALGMITTMVGMAVMGGGDGEDDEWQNIPEFVKERALVIPLGHKDYMAIPLPLGFHVFPNLGRLMAEWAMGGPDKSLGKQVGKVLGSLVESFNPVGGGSDIGQVVMPTVMDPLLALWRNQDWTGRPIYREDNNSLDPTPGLSRTKDTASTPGRLFAEAINWITGGNEYRPGIWSPTPDQFDYVIGQLTGGLGRELLKVEQVISTPFTGDELPAHKIPVLGRIYGNTRGAGAQSGVFYENVRTLNEVENELKGRLKNDDGVDEFMDNEPLTGLVGDGNASEKAVRELRKQRRQEMQDAEPGYKDRVKEINTQIEEEMRNLNRAVSAVKNGDAE